MVILSCELISANYDYTDVVAALSPRFQKMKIFHFLKAEVCSPWLKRV